MKFNLEDIEEAEKAFAFLTELVGTEVIVDIKKVSPTRSLNQNAYLHLLLAAFGNNFGYTLEEAKTIYKREVNPDLYVYTKNEQRFLHSSAELSKEDMAKSIDKFHTYSAEAGFPLPLATDTGYMIELENEIERSKYYL